MPDAPLQPVAERKTVELMYAPPRRSWQRRLSSTLRSWARSTFSRESYVSSLRSLLWVVPLTVLIWIYAEREQVVTARDVIIKVRTPAEDSGRIVRIIPPTDNTVHVDMRGPQVAIDQVKDYIENTIIPIEVDRALTRGEQQIDIASQLNKLPEVVSKGVTVDRCTPPRMSVSIDPIEEKEVKVKAPADYAGAPPVFNPPQVRLRGPESEVEHALKSGHLIAYADLRQFETQLAQAGTQNLTGVPLLPPTDMNPSEVTFLPAAVTARVEVPKSERTITLPYVTVFAAYPEVPKADQFRAEYMNTVPAVRVTGPADEITKLETGATPAVAYFRVDLDNPDTTTPRTAPVIFDLPPGVRVVDQDKNRTVTYSLKPRPKTDQ
jgi:hypothetical protein